MRCMTPVALYEELVKSKSLRKGGRFLGLDVGGKYVGVSVSDEHSKIALPGSVLLRKKPLTDLIATDFQSVISKLSIVGLIVGYPFDKQRRCSHAVQINCFIDDLCATGKLEGVRYTYWNECLTSKNVQIFVQPVKHSKHAKTIDDKFAAIGILQGYLDFVNRNERLRALAAESSSVEEESDDVEAESSSVEEESDDVEAESSSVVEESDGVVEGSDDEV